MTVPDDGDLDRLLHAAATAQPDAADQERVFEDAWARVRSSLACGDEPGDELQRRLDLIADRELSARRRRRANRLASVTLAVVVAGAGTAAAARVHLHPNRRGADREPLTACPAGCHRAPTGPRGG